LAEAVDLHHDSIMMTLLKSGAKVLNPLDIVYNAMRIAIKDSNSDVVQTLLEYDHDCHRELDSFLHLAARVYHKVSMSEIFVTEASPSVIED